ncbi:hypothetical protein [Phenylobacterium terrae]|uniref:hypothetical protein n=1 Tax=Phenylobacterium terrae TaxID=2665495 RepID=UPI00366DF672
MTAEACAAWETDAARVAAFDAAAQARWDYLRDWTDHAQALAAWRKQRLVELGAWPPSPAMRQGQLHADARLLQLDREARAGIESLKSRLQGLGFIGGRMPDRLACGPLISALQEMDQLLDLLGRADVVTDELYSAEARRAGVVLD